MCTTRNAWPAPWRLPATAARSLARPPRWWCSTPVRFARMPTTGSMATWGTCVLDRTQVPQVAIEPVVGILANRTGVEHHHLGGLASDRAPVAGSLQGAGQAFRVVHVHLTPVGAHLVAPTGAGSADRHRWGSRRGARTCRTHSDYLTQP